MMLAYLVAIKLLNYVLSVIRLIIYQNAIKSQDACGGKMSILRKSESVVYIARQISSVYALSEK